MIESAISQVCVYYVSKHLKFDSYIGPSVHVIFLIITFILTIDVFYIKDNFFNLIDNHKYNILVFCISMFMYVKIFSCKYHEKVFNYIKNIFSNESIEIYEHNTMKIILIHMIKNKCITFDEMKCDDNSISVYNSEIDESLSFIPKKIYHFYDKQNNIAGTLKFTKYEYDRESGIRSPPFISLSVTKNNNIGNIDYIKLIKSQETVNYNKTIKIVYVHEKEDYYNSECFLPAVDNLFGDKLKFATKIKNIYDENLRSYKEQLSYYSPNNYILEGPPGTGKSFFISNLASYIGTSVVILPNNLIINGDILKINKIITSNLFVHNKRPPIFVFEEIDNLIDMIISNKNTSKKNDNGDDKNESPKISNTVRILLNIIQSSFTHPLSMFIATTNKLDYIKSIIPELVRIGRLTPVHFGNYTAKDLQDVIKSKYLIDYEFDNCVEYSVSPVSIHSLITSIRHNNIMLSLQDQGQIFINRILTNKTTSVIEDID